MRFEILKPGLLTTIQDLGRFGYQQFGVQVAGAMDRLSLVVANRLAGNPDYLAGLEVTLWGPTVRVLSDGVVAIAGADLSPTLDGKPLPMWRTLAVRAGQTIEFGARRSGARAYVAVRGGIAVPVVLGSRSTHARSHTGGLAGRTLARGHVIEAGPPPAGPLREREIPSRHRPVYGTDMRLRVVLGPQQDHFRPEAVETFLHARYTVSPQSDRMGYRLEGPPLAHLRGADLVSDATPFGAIQVPANGQPILLMADRQTTGGYPKLAVVASVDLPLAAQLAPGDGIRFRALPVADAQEAYRLQAELLASVLPP